MYAVTSIWLLSFTRATLRSAEFGFLGVVVYTRVHTPRRWGLPFSAGVLVLLVFAWRPFRTSCWIVGTGFLRSLRPLPTAAAPSCMHLCVPVTSPAGEESGTRGRACRPAHGPATRGHAFRVLSLSAPRCLGAVRSSCRCPRTLAGSWVVADPAGASLGGARTSCPSKLGHEGKDYPPQASRSKSVNC